MFSKSVLVLCLLSLCINTKKSNKYSYDYDEDNLDMQDSPLTNNQPAITSSTIPNSISSPTQTPIIDIPPHTTSVSPVITQKPLLPTPQKENGNGGVDLDNDVLVSPELQKLIEEHIKNIIKNKSKQNSNTSEPSSPMNPKPTVPKAEPIPKNMFDTSYIYGICDSIRYFADAYPSFNTLLEKCKQNKFIYRDGVSYPDARTIITTKNTKGLPNYIIDVNNEDLSSVVPGALEIYIVMYRTCETLVSELPDNQKEIIAKKCYLVLGMPLKTNLLNLNSTANTSFERPSFYVPNKSITNSSDMEVEIAAQHVFKLCTIIKNLNKIDTKVYYNLYKKCEMFKPFREFYIEKSSISNNKPTISKTDKPMKTNRTLSIMHPKTNSIKPIMKQPISKSDDQMCYYIYITSHKDDRGEQILKKCFPKASTTDSINKESIKENNNKIPNINTESKINESPIEEKPVSNEKPEKQVTPPNSNLPNIQIDPVEYNVPKNSTSTINNSQKDIEKEPSLPTKDITNNTPSLIPENPEAPSTEEKEPNSSISSTTEQNSEPNDIYNESLESENTIDSSDSGMSINNKGSQDTKNEPKYQFIDVPL